MRVRFQKKREKGVHMRAQNLCMSKIRRKKNRIVLTRVILQPLKLQDIEYMHVNLINYYNKYQSMSPSFTKLAMLRSRDTLFSV